MRKVQMAIPKLLGLPSEDLVGMKEPVEEDKPKEEENSNKEKIGGERVI